MFNNPLKTGDVIRSAEVRRIFKCSLAGGMNRSLKTNTLVIVSKVGSIYGDSWDGNILHYTGHGLKGDQRLWKQNKTLYESDSNGVGVYLFEVRKKSIYTYLGQVELAGTPYQGEEEDEDKRNRKVWKFLLRLKSGEEPIPVPLQDHQARQERREKKASQYSDSELKDRLPADANKPGKRKTTTYSYIRNEYVIIATLKRAGGICQLCDGPAPFNKRGGEPFLEVHHIKQLAKGGEDTLRNAVALCPNCHRKIHSLNKKADVKKLATAASQT